MSECRKEQITCPRCHYDSPMTMWGSINVDLDPELKEQLLSGDLFQWKCEVCGEECFVPYGTMYHDMTHKFMLFFDPWEDRENKYEEFEVPIPQEFGVSNYTFRSVFGINALREKIDIFEAGLNDIAIERMKVFLRLNPENEIRPTDAIYFHSIDKDPERMRKSGFERGAIVFAKVPKEGEPSAMGFRIEAYFDFLLAVEKDPRMQVKGCTCVDSNWMETKLRSL